MSKKEAPLHHLQNYLPAGTYEAVLNYLRQYKVHLTITKQRKSIWEIIVMKHPAVTTVSV